MPASAGIRARPLPAVPGALVLRLLYELLHRRIAGHASLPALGLAPADEKFAFTAAMIVLTFAYALILHVFVEVPARRAADGWLAVQEAG